MDKCAWTIKPVYNDHTVHTYRDISSDALHALALYLLVALIATKSMLLSTYLVTDTEICSTFAHDSSKLFSCRVGHGLPPAYILHTLHLVKNEIH